MTSIVSEFRGVAVQDHTRGAVSGLFQDQFQWQGSPVPFSQQAGCCSHNEAVSFSALHLDSPLWNDFNPQIWHFVQNRLVIHYRVESIQNNMGTFGTCLNDSDDVFVRDIKLSSSKLLVRFAAYLV